MNTLEIIITVLSTLLVASWFGLYNMLTKYEDAEDTILELEDKLLANKNVMKSTVDNMRIIDSKGGFESDDEVGGVFEALKNEIENLDHQENL